MKLGIGTVQFGQNYGVSNFKGQTSNEEAIKIIDLASASDIQDLDTAGGYGESEKIIGNILASRNNFRIVTKIPAIGDLTISGKKHVQDNLAKSLLNLKKKAIYGLLIHRASDLLGNSGKSIAEAMEEAKFNGQVSRIGVSIYAEDDLDAIFSKFTFDIVQLPLNILDQRLINSGFIDACSRKGIEIQVRSVFLQGLLLMEINRIPDFFNPVRPIITRFHALCNSQGWSRVEGAYRFIRSVSPIQTVIIGVNDAAQLEENIQMWNNSAGRLDEGLFKEFSIENKNYLNPSLWKIK